MTAAVPKTSRPRGRPPLSRPRGASRSDGKVGVTLRLPPRLHTAVKRLALDLEEAERREVTLLELFLDGLGLVFEKHGRARPELDR